MSTHDRPAVHGAGACEGEARAEIRQANRVGCGLVRAGRTGWPRVAVVQVAPDNNGGIFIGGDGGGGFIIIELAHCSIAESIASID